jgi:hypothetical protein
MRDIDEPELWPLDTLVLRGGVGGAYELAQRRSVDGTWSVVAASGLTVERLATSVRNNQVRVTTVGLVRAAGGWVRPSPGPPFHCDLGGLTAVAFDGILGPPIANPVPAALRWKP